MKKSHELDMTVGSILPKLLLFAVPVMLSGLLQLLFNAADLVVVGRFAGSEPLAQVGATGALINLIVNLLIGLAIGANVTLAHFYGAKDRKGISDTVHTTILLAVIGGVLIGVLGFALAAPLLKLMGTPDDILDGAVLYMRIIFVGVPVSAVSVVSPLAITTVALANGCSSSVTSSTPITFPLTELMMLRVSVSKSAVAASICLSTDVKWLPALTVSVRLWGASMASKVHPPSASVTAG